MKTTIFKISSLLLAFFISAASILQSTNASETRSVKKGDLTGDGEISLEDVTLALKGALTITPLTGDTLLAADINEDSDLTLEDVREILELALLITSEDFVVNESGLLTEYKGSSGEVIIPYGVKGIAKGVFSNNKSITSVTVPNGVTKIEESAFSYSSLERISLPESLEYIGDYAFARSSLEQLSLPESLEYIGDSVFYYCSALMTVNVPEDIIYLGKDSFKGCSGLADDIGFIIVNHILYDASRIGTYPEKEIVIPESVRIIGHAAFEEVWSFEKIVLPEGVEEIEDRAFLLCSTLTDITVPSSVKKIGVNAFDGVGQGFTIHGYEGSYAQSFSMEQGIDFQIISR